MEQTIDENPRVTAAQLLAESDLGYEEIADKCGVSRQTLYNWRRDPEFQEVVELYQEAFKERIRHRGIAVCEQRVFALQDRWRRMKRIIEERAADPKMAEVPGGKTGLLVRQMKQLGAGVAAQVIEEYVLDAALLREMREHEQQAAKELGQWIEKSERASTMRVTQDDELDLLSEEDLVKLRDIRLRLDAAHASATRPQLGRN